MITKKHGPNENAQIGRFLDIILTPNGGQWLAMPLQQSGEHEQVVHLL